MDPFWGVVIGVLAATGTILGVFATFYKSRSEAKQASANAKTALDARIDARVETQLSDAWARIDEIDTAFKALEKRETRRTGAITRILKAIAAQWPGSHGPDLDPADIAEIEETIPPTWIRKKSTPA
jgi:Flp pilus assembly protein TadB